MSSIETSICNLMLSVYGSLRLISKDDGFDIEVDNDLLTVEAFHNLVSIYSGKYKCEFDWDEKKNLTTYKFRKYEG